MKRTRIHKITKDPQQHQWVTVLNEVAQSKTLSYEAKGLLLDLLSRPEGWVLNVAAMNCGRVKAARIIAELVEHGYAVPRVDDEGKPVRVRKGGKFVGQDYDIYEAPHHCTKPAMVKNRNGVSTVDDQALETKHTDKQNNIQNVVVDDTPSDTGEIMLSGENPEPRQDGQHDSPAGEIARRLTDYGIALRVLEKKGVDIASLSGELVEANIAFADKTPGIRNKAGWVVDQLARGDMPPKRKTAFDAWMDDNGFEHDDPPLWVLGARQDGQLESNTGVKIAGLRDGMGLVAGGEREWDIARAQLEIQFDRASFQQWFSGVHLVGTNEARTRYVLAARSPVVQDMLNSRLRHVIEQVLSVAAAGDVSVDVTLLDAVVQT